MAGGDEERGEVAPVRQPHARHDAAAELAVRHVDEFTFRLNEGNCEIDTEDRLASLFRAMVGKKITYAELTG